MGKRPQRFLKPLGPGCCRNRKHLANYIFEWSEFVTIHYKREEPEGILSTVITLWVL